METEIFVACYPLESDGSAKTGTVSLEFHEEYQGYDPTTHQRWADKRPILVLNDRSNNFWPVIIHLDPEDFPVVKAELQNVLRQIEKYEQDNVSAR